MRNISVMRWALAFTSLLLSANAGAAVPGKLAAFPEGERLVYSRIVEAYRHNNYAAIVKQRQLLEHNYPRSVHLDNAYYLSGMLELQNNRIGEALKTFDVVRDHFAKSNKRPAAMFASGAAYQKLNLPVLANRVFQRVITEYPGSPEAQRAWMQLKVTKIMANTPGLKR